ncbi:receptor-like protein EIX1 [Pyrus x bretschneideri]|uniref:receptor-like protein EIX1 n=1 Tax=Pyrus x bretschneideri TaxID=225117 RepID=UPI00202DF54A|nr:receptor-like protein EIX1 [Pyrus x bretschneideri]
MEPKYFLFFIVVKMQGQGIRCFKLFHASIFVALIVLQYCIISQSLEFNNISSGVVGHRDFVKVPKVIRCIEREREALLAFKQGLADDYNLLSSWGREVHKQDCCKWVGVHCSNRNNHVTQLNLGRDRLDQAYSLQQKGQQEYMGYYLQGKMISPKLIELQHLKYLALSSVNFNGTRLPDFIGSLSNLRHLDLSNAFFGSRFPSQVGNLTHLQYLDISINYFNHVENLNSWLPHLSSLAYLDMSNTNLSNVRDWLEAINKLPKLTNLNLLGCGLASPAIHFSTLFNVNSSKTLAHVDLGYNQLTSPSIFLWLSNYNVSLVDLALSSNSLTGLIPHVFGNMSSLVHLDLGDNQIEVGIPQSFSKLCNLQALYLDNNILSLQLSWLVQILMSTCPDQNSLETLYLTNNHLSGSIPNLTNFSLLKELDLSLNHVSGTIPESVGHMSNLEDMWLGMNALEGIITETHFSNLSRLISLDLSSNSLALSFSSNWVPLFQLQYISLGSCMMGPHFPKWLQTQKSYLSLDISNAGISDILPNWFWGMSPQDYIDLSNNQIRGIISNPTFDFSSFPQKVNLSWNQLEGPIPTFLSKASSLDLSNNKFSGLVSFLFPKTPIKASNLTFLDLSSNQLSEELPDCGMHFGNLVFLDLSNNALSGKIHTIVDSLYSIQTLKLNNNRFVGKLPSSLKNCTRLTVFDVGENELSGLLPEWLGVGLLNLAILILRSNHFYGSIPSQLCNMRSIQILDLSMNNISGSIPKCLNSLTLLAQKGSSRLNITHEYQGVYRGNSSVFYDYADEESLIWKGVMSKFKSTLGLVKSIDLSSNRLMGEIPSEITDLGGLVSLNLSRNNLTGQITPKIGKLQSLDSLDLSNNQIYGMIPTSLFRISGLGKLDLSNNNLSGEIPMGTQLQNYEPSDFAGNPLLCGIPLQQLCSTEEQPVFRDQVEEKDGLITSGFYVSLVLGFVVGFWGICGSLIFIRSWRYTYYKFLNYVYDWLYVRGGFDQATKNDYWVNSRASTVRKPCSLSAREGD